MFSKSPTFDSKFVEFSFIAGIKKKKIIKDNYTKEYKPKCLFAYPKNDKVFSQVSELVYPLNARILPETAEDSIDFFSTLLTNEKASQTYIYVLRMYDIIDNMKVPIAICFGSKINDTEAFKNLLNEIYMIKTSDFSVSTKQIELINYLMFVHSLMIPPPHTLMKLNMRYMSVDFYFHSRCEIPCSASDTNINILFAVLDMGIIIELWLNLLKEKKVIIYGSKPFLLNAICDAITKLLFPFKWQQTYYSCLSKANLYLLDIPCPALFGVLSPTIDIKALKKTYPGYCIVDLETGDIESQIIGKLPREVEILLRKKIQILKNPELFEIAELFKDEKNAKEIQEDINPNLSFSSNIQKIFFHIIKEHLVNYGNYLDMNKKIEEKRFLSKIQVSEMKSIWDKLIQTTMFDCFTQMNKCKDDCNNRIFEELCNEDKMSQRNITNCFKIELTMPPLHSKGIMKMLNEIEIDNAELERMLKQYTQETKQADFFLSARKLSSSSLSPCKQDLLFNVNSIQRGTDEDMNNSCDSSNDNDFELINLDKSPQLKMLMTNVNANSNSNGNGNSNNVYGTNTNTMSSKKHSFKLMYRQEQELKLPSLISTPLLTSFKDKCYINSVSNVSGKQLDFYSEKGFIAFIKLAMKLFEGNKYELIDVLFKKQFLDEIIESSNMLYDSIRDINDIPEEKEGEDIDGRTPQISKQYLKSNSNLKSDMKKIIKMNMFSSNTNANLNLSKKYLFYAFYLEEILKYPENIFNLDHNDINNYIISFYHKAALNDQKEFPYYRYSALISKCSQEKLKLLESNAELSPVKDIIQYMLNNLFKNLRVPSKTNLLTRIESPRINKKNTFSMTPKYMKRYPSLFTPENNHPTSLRESNSQSKSLLDDESIFNDITIVSLSKQMKKEIRYIKKNQMNKAKDKDVLNDTAIQNKEIIQSLKLIQIDTCVSEFTFKDDKLNEAKINFRRPKTINIKKKVTKPSEPLTLMVSIGEKIIAYISKFKSIHSHNHKDNESSLINDFNQIINLVERLQRVNLAKIPKAEDQYSFWLNAFNFLVLYAILLTKFEPKSFEQWGRLMTNCLFKIGGYEMSLYEIENKILSCCNFHGEDIKFTDLITANFCIDEDNILIDFALFFPIRDKKFYLTVYHNDKFEEEIYQTAKIFLNKNIDYNKETKVITVTSYFNQIMPLFVEKNYIHYENHIDQCVYAALKNKEYTSKVVINTAWEFSLY